MVQKIGRYRLSTIGCDDRIAARLAQEVGAPPGEFFHMARWMGMPYEAHYPQRAQRYLAHEIAVMHEIATNLAGAQADMGRGHRYHGSVIYVPEATILELRRAARLVYLAPPLDAFQTMLQSYLKLPGLCCGTGFTNRPRTSPPWTLSSAAIPNCSPAGITFTAATAT